MNTDKEKAIIVLRDFFAIEGEAPLDFAVMSRRLYKATSCGAWIAEEANGVAIGSIVEGSDCDCQTHRIEWAKITEESLNEAIAAIEDEAEELWNEANGEEEFDEYEDDSPRGMGWVGCDGLP